MLELDITSNKIGGYLITADVNMALNTVTLETTLRTPDRNRPPGKMIYSSEVTLSATAETVAEAATNLRKKIEQHLNKLTRANQPWPSRDATKFIELFQFAPLPPSTPRYEQQQSYPDRIHAH